ncbi:MAG: hypothetical protein KC492_16805 [Myxococcales bacterium]|nr:hypothetical protein [Myxococcales bacterium]
MGITKRALDELRAGDPQLDLMLDAIAAGLVTFQRANRDALDLVDRYFSHWEPDDLGLVFQEDPWSWAGKLHFWDLSDAVGYAVWQGSELSSPPPELEVLRLRIRYFQRRRSKPGTS